MSWRNEIVQRAYLVHVVPNVQIWSTLNPAEGALNSAGLEHLPPPIPRLGVEEIRPRASSGPAPALILSLPALRLDEDPKVRCFLESRVIGGPPEMRINNSHHLNNSQPLDLRCRQKNEPCDRWQQRR